MRDGVAVPGTAAAGGSRCRIGQYHHIRGPVDLARLTDAIHRVIEHPVDTADLSKAPGAARQWMRDRLADRVDRPADHALLVLGRGEVAWFQAYADFLADARAMSLVADRVARAYTTGAVEPLDHHAEPTYPQPVQDREFWLRRALPAPVSLAGRRAPAAPARLVSVDAGPATARWTRVLAAAMAAYLHRMTGERRVSLGLSLAAAARPANVLPLVLDVTPGTTVEELVTRTVFAVRDLLDHQRYPGADLARDLALPGGVADFGPSLDLRPNTGDLRLGECRATVHDLSVPLVDDLSVVAHGRDTLRLELAGNPELYGETDLRAHGERLAGLLGRFRGDTPVGDLDLVSDLPPRQRFGALQTVTATLPRAWPAAR